MPADLLEKLDIHCKEYSYERSEYIRNLIRIKLFSEYPGNVLQQAEEKAEHLSQPTNDMGNCYYCKYFKELKLVTYLDDDQVKQVNKLCSNCIQKSKVSGMFKGEGDLI